MTHYEVLGVRGSATQYDIKKAYRDFVKLYHPDINRSADAPEKMRAANEAYEVLSNTFSRNLYDLMLSGEKVEEKETEKERYKREYVRKRSQQQRERFEYLIKLKVRFYRIERMFCILFFIAGFVLTVDYYFTSYEKSVSFTEVFRGVSDSRVKTEVGLFTLDKSFYPVAKRSESKQLTLAYSSVFKVLTKVKLEGVIGEFKVQRTLHSFRNIFSIIILIFTAIVVKHKEYTDFRLSCGLVPAFILIFLGLFIYSEIGNTVFIGQTLP